MGNPMREVIVGNRVVTPSKIVVLDATTEMTFELKKNGDIVPIGHMELMIHKPQEILSEILTPMA